MAVGRKLIAALAMVMAASVVMQCGADRTSTAEQPRRLTVPNVDDGAPPLAEIYVQRGSRALERGEEINPVVFAMWEDGRVIWSDDRELGGPPYKEARIKPEKVREVLEKIGKRNLFNTSLQKHAVLIVDGVSKMIYVRCGKDVLYLYADEHVNASDYGEKSAQFAREWEAVKRTLLESIPQTRKAAPQVRFEPQRFDRQTGTRIRTSPVGADATTTQRLLTELLVQ